MKLQILACVAVALATSASAQVVKPVFTVCKVQTVAGNTTYKATVTWAEQLVYYPNGPLAIGMVDRSGAGYTQALKGSAIDARGTDTDTFVVSDSSLYPLDTAIYSFSPSAYKSLSKGAKAFPFPPSGVGVARATDVVRLTSPTAVALCKK
ncbi:MAG: hypothetical protein V4574_12585 [Pseudomonadota bacterium]